LIGLLLLPVVPAVSVPCVVGRASLISTGAFEFVVPSKKKPYAFSLTRGLAGVPIQPP
jgi:hypothetical protein